MLREVKLLVAGLLIIAAFWAYSVYQVATDIQNHSAEIRDGLLGAVREVGKAWNGR